MTDNDPNRKLDEYRDELKRGLDGDALTLHPYYSDARNAVIKPQLRCGSISMYFLKRWLPRLGPDAACLIIALRELVNERVYRGAWSPEVTNPGRKDSVEMTAAELGALIGVSHKTVRRLLQREDVQLFVTKERAFKPRSGGADGSTEIGGVHWVLMDDPVAPEDLPGIQDTMVDRMLSAALDAAGQTVREFTAFPGQNVQAPVVQNVQLPDGQNVQAPDGQSVQGVRGQNDTTTEPSPMDSLSAGQNGARDGLSALDIMSGRINVERINYVSSNVNVGDASSIWKATLGLLKEAMEAPSFATLSMGTAEWTGDDAITLWYSSALFTERAQVWSAAIEQCFSVMVGRDVSVGFQVDPVKAPIPAAPTTVAKARDLTPEELATILEAPDNIRYYNVLLPWLREIKQMKLVVEALGEVQKSSVEGRIHTDKARYFYGILRKLAETEGVPLKRPS